MTCTQGRLLSAAALISFAGMAWMHGDHGSSTALGSGSFTTDLLHPFTGWDHVAAMLAVNF